MRGATSSRSAFSLQACSATRCTSHPSSSLLTTPTPSPKSFQRALEHQPKHALLPAPLDTLVPLALFAAGQTFVITSTYALGITGTFLGDYFGILMDHRVEGFPFNVLRDPMYVGSTMSFAATALWCVPLVPLPRVLQGGCVVLT